MAPYWEWLHRGQVISDVGVTTDLELKSGCCGSATMPGGTIQEAMHVNIESLWTGGPMQDPVCPPTELYLVACREPIFFLCGVPSSWISQFATTYLAPPFDGF